MGRGPSHFVRLGAGSQLRALGHTVEAETVAAPESTTTLPTEIGTTAALQRSLAGRVAAAAGAGALPVVLSGNCGSALGTVAGLRTARAARGLSPRVEVVWLDGHADFNTPDTTESGFLDGMALATLAGRCWPRLASSIPGYMPVAEHDITLVGARDVDPAERTALDSSGLRQVTVAEVRAGTALPTGQPGPEEAGIYLHIDLDVLDPVRVGRANALAPPDGLTVAEVQSVVAAVARTGRFSAICLASYDPECDTSAAVWRAGVALLECAVTEASLAAGPPSDG